jgi:diguanylate cyclase (GGDEF)-like protein
MSNLYVRYKIRLLLLGMAALAVIITAIHLAVYVASKNIAEDHFQSAAKGMAVSIADTLTMNIQEYRAFAESRDVGSDYYKRMQTYFQDIKANSNVRFIYTEHRLDENTVEFILDAEEIGHKDYNKPGSTAENNDLKEEVYNSGVPSGFPLTDFEEWGKLLGAFAPIFDSAGEIVGLVGVDVDGSHLFSSLSNLKTALMIIYGVITALSLALLLMYSNAILDPLFKDKLTGAYSKRHFEDFLGNEIAHAAKAKKDLALLMLDLDHFKMVNDTYGHVFGDKVLSTVSEIIKKSLRPKDYFIRYGGEEFAAIITGANINHVMAMAERIRKSVEGHPIFNREKDVHVSITISIGVSSLGNSPAESAALIENADHALYEAKTTRNRVCLFGAK